MPRIECTVPASQRVMAWKSSSTPPFKNATPMSPVATMRDVSSSTSCDSRSPSSNSRSRWYECETRVRERFARRSCSRQLGWKYSRLHEADACPAGSDAQGAVMCVEANSRCMARREHLEVRPTDPQPAELFA
ncbi:MAG: hypothetical protein JNM17_10360 [Archangium sp.]|nr:hypothetical protein [Archangium sp.]